MCKKQASVFHNLTESEIVSLDTELRLDRLLALELWDLIVSVFGNISHVSDRTHNKIDVMKDIDTVPSNVKSAIQERFFFF